MASVRDTPIGKSPLLPIESAGDSVLVSYEDGGVSDGKDQVGVATADAAERAASK